MFACQRSVAAGLVAAAIVIAPAGAETIKITAVGAPPPQVTPVKAVIDYVIPEINKRLAASGKDFKIEWNTAWAQSLAKTTEVLETVQEGIAQFGVQLVIFEESKLPLEQYSHVVPFGVTDPLMAEKIDGELRKKVPEMDAYWNKYNQVRLAVAGTLPVDILTRFPVKAVADLKGHKIGASGSMGQFLRGTGAVVVNGAMIDAYTDIKNGVEDGYISSIGLAFPYKIFEPAPYFTFVNFSASVTAELTMNKDAWAKLPAFAQAIVRDVTSHYGEVSVKIDTGREAAFRKMMEKKGVHFTDLPAAERKKWAEMMPNVPKQWAESLEKRGEPGMKVLTAYMDALRARHIETYRQWDKE